MIDVQPEQEYPRLSIGPAVIHLQELAPGRVAEEPRRRITVVLDHPVVKQLGWFSWLLVIVARAATRSATAIPMSVLVLAGLLIGIINATRWLFARKR
jgi:hypothetical protein